MMAAMPGAMATFNCGRGYISSAHAKIDGISASQCEKLWCRDLETNKPMGAGNTPASGYRTTPEPVQLCDAANNCIDCWGERKWCNGESVGQWNPEYGAYTRGGEDNATYKSYHKAGCFAWRLEKPNCAAGLTAIEQGGRWHCAVSTGTTDATRASSIRRTGTMRRIGR